MPILSENLNLGAFFVNFVAFCFNPNRLVTNGEKFTEENEGNEDLVAGTCEVRREDFSHPSSADDSHEVFASRRFSVIKGFSS
jgi:hypothetical protein